jgi:hypothetical protein
LRREAVIKICSIVFPEYLEMKVVKVVMSVGYKYMSYDFNLPY